MEPTFDVDIEDVLDGLTSVAARVKDLRPVFVKLVPVAKRDLRASGRLREGAAKKWPPHAASTLRKRRQSRRRRRRVRQMMGQLTGTAVTVTARHDRLREESRVDWSGAHQDGATVGRGAKLPAREHVYFSEQFLELATKRLVDHVWSVW
jgi:hypothetical protein